jgi:hypothetical protein
MTAQAAGPSRSSMKMPRRAWQKLSAGAGAKGHRSYDWAVIDLAEPRPGSHQLLIRRNRTTGELAYYRCFSTAPAPLTTLVRVAGARRRAEPSRPGAGLSKHRGSSAVRVRTMGAEPALLVTDGPRGFTSRVDLLP